MSHSNFNPLPGIGGILAIVFLISTLSKRESCNINCAKSPSHRSSTKSLSLEEKREEIMQVLMTDNEQGKQLLAAINNDLVYQQLLETMKYDEDFIIIIKELREKYRFKKEPLRTFSIETVTPKDPPAKFVPTKLNVSKAVKIPAPE